MPDGKGSQMIMYVIMEDKAFKDLVAKAVKPSWLFIKWVFN